MIFYYHDLVFIFASTMFNKLNGLIKPFVLYIHTHVYVYM